MNRRHDKEINALRKKYEQETRVKLDALEKIEVLKDEIRSLEAGNTNANSIRQLKQIWKELQSNNQLLRNENESLRDQLSSKIIDKNSINRERQSYKERLEQSIKESQISNLPAAARAQLRETGQFVGSIPPSISSINYQAKAENMMKQIEGSADPKLRKGGTPHINTDMHNTSQFNSWKYGNTTTNRQREVMSIGRQANEKLHTPSMKSEMNVTFNKGPR